MSILLNLGVIDQPYSEEAETTGDVAQKLEKEYGLMAKFIELHEKEILDSVLKSLEKSTNQISKGLIDPLTFNAFGATESKIEHMFKLWLTTQVESSGIAGVPTKAALEGRSHRMKYRGGKWVKRKKKEFGVRRQSFIDTGLYESSFKCWTSKGA